MPSITTWNRLEARARSEDLTVNLQFQIRDPLWLMARQWQFGEFQGEDAGSPVVAELESSSARLTRYQLGTLNGGVTGQRYTSESLPLEILVERETARTDGLDARTAAEAGSHFLRLLHDFAPSADLDPEYIAKYGFELPDDATEGTLDHDSLRFLRIMAGRGLDGRELYATLAAVPPDDPLPVDDFVDSDHEIGVRNALEKWRDWYENLFSGSSGAGSAWQPERMEYAFAVAAPTARGELTLTASEYLGGHLDWHSFTVEANASLGAELSDYPEGDGIRQQTTTVIPAPLTFHGMPSSRLWEFEDAQIDFGAVEAATQDLARLLLMEFALIYGNDWFVIPVELDIGTVCRINFLRVTNTFGETFAIQRSDEVDSAAPWRMFRLSEAGIQAPASDVFFLPPALATSLHSRPIEEVRFIRDEMANYAWAIERLVERPNGKVLDRHEFFQEMQRRSADPEDAGGGTSQAELIYRLATTVPDYWMPLLPVPVDPARRAVRLRRGAMLQEDLTFQPPPLGSLLEELGDDLLYEEEVSRAGAQVKRSYQYTRWIGGSSHLWVARHKQPGRGGGTSGLRYDSAE